MTFLPATAIIAGGTGSRLGGNKLATKLGNVTLFDHAVHLARGYTDIVIVVVRDEQADIPVNPLERVYDDPAIAGPLAGIAAALNWGQANGRTHILALASDTPFLPANLLDRLRHHINGDNIIFGDYDGRLQPLASLWPVSALRHLPGYLASGKKSVIGFGEYIGLVTVSWPLGEINPFFNINDPGDLSEAEQMFMLHLRNKSV
ncbi:molybdenum cofactor guanylyltransferase [Sphingorhabdus arenilitoris]|uniref:Molybdenum cofactor guanylyltransferase n=1 Tax=Sphingorhabdus arenilitoris TaxID=1490041 RepID=A0ABV8RFQ1_9SPHN